jgi:hypothetical protein
LTIGLEFWLLAALALPEAKITAPLSAFLTPGVGCPAGFQCPKLSLCRPPLPAGTVRGTYPFFRRKPKSCAFPLCALLLLYAVFKDHPACPFRL